MRPMGFIETDSSKIRIKFITDDTEHGRGAVVNWKSYNKENKSKDMIENIFEEENVDFESGWPWYWKLEDSDYPNAYPWKIGLDSI